MKTNMGMADKVLRILAAIVVTILYFMGVIQGPVAIGLLIVAGIFLVTGFVGFCPLYTIFGISTNKKKSHGA